MLKRTFSGVGSPPGWKQQAHQSSQRPPLRMKLPAAKIDLKRKFPLEKLPLPTCAKSGEHSAKKTGPTNFATQDSKGFNQTCKKRHTFQRDDPRKDPRTHLVGAPPVWLMSSLGRKLKEGGRQKQPNTKPPRHAMRVCVWYVNHIYRMDVVGIHQTFTQSTNT